MNKKPLGPNIVSNISYTGSLTDLKSYLIKQVTTAIEKKTPVHKTACLSLGELEKLLQTVNAKLDEDEAFSKGDPSIGFVIICIDSKEDVVGSAVVVGTGYKLITEGER